MARPPWQDHHGKTAGVKIDLAFDLLTGSIISHSLQAGCLAELAAFDPDPRHVVRDKLTRKSPVESGILALT